MKKHKVIYFKSIINFMMNHAKGILGIIIITITIIVSPKIYAIINYICISNEINISNFYQQLITAVISSIIPIIYAGLTRIYKNWNRNIKACKRIIYRNCLKLLKSEKTGSILKKISKLIIHVFYYQKRVPISIQQGIVNDILNKLNTHSAIEADKRVFWIQGSPYSGKTTTVFNLFVDLISKKEYAELFEQLDNKTIYIDLGREDFNILTLIEDYKYGKYENYLLVLDNLHKTSNSSCVSVINEIVLSIHAYAIIIILRRPEDFLCDPEKIVFLETIMCSIGSSYNLPQMSPTNFYVYKENAFSTFCSQFGFYDYNERTVIIHLASLYSRKGVDEWHLLDDIRLFIQGKEIPNSTWEKLIAIIAVCLFTGSFNIQALQVCDHGSTHSWKKFVQRLLAIGFLANYPHPSDNYYYFHESLAKFYFDKNYVLPRYKEQYLRYFKRLLKYYSDKHNQILTYLYSILIDNSSNLKKLFDQIVINANFINLYNELEFLLSRNEEKRSAYYRELGILCDRMGKLKEAKKYYLQYLEKDKSPDAFYKLVQIDHDYLPQYPDIAREAKESMDCYYRLLAKYWEAHVKMHNGYFNFGDFSEMVMEGQEQCDNILHEHPYDGLHLLRRIYFDCFRIYYLNGELNPSELHFIVTDNSRLKRMLQAKLDEFDAYYIKFALGQFLAQDLLFMLAFLSKGLDKNNYNIFLADRTSLSFEKMSNAKAIAEEAVSQYKTAIKRFEKIGDKTATFVRYHMYNVKMILVDDGDFSECEQFYEEYMAFATRENDIEYQSYAELFKLKLLLVKISSPSVIYSELAYDDLIIQAKNKIAITRKYQELCNIQTGNSYAELRLDFYETLLDFVTQNIKHTEFKERILSLQDRADALNYKRELYMTKYIERYQFNPSREQIRIIVTYYPIITQ